MNFITREILQIIFKSANANFNFKKSAMVNSKAKHTEFKFFYFYDVNDTTVSTIKILQQHFKKFYPTIHCNIVQNKNGLTVWVSDNLKYDALMVK